MLILYLSGSLNADSIFIGEPECWFYTYRGLILDMLKNIIFYQRFWLLFIGKTSNPRYTQKIVVVSTDFVNNSSKNRDNFVYRGIKVM